MWNGLISSKMGLELTIGGQVKSNPKSHQRLVLIGTHPYWLACKKFELEGSKMNTFVSSVSMWTQKMCPKARLASTKVAKNPDKHRTSNITF